MADNNEKINSCNEVALSPFSPGRVKCKCIIWNTCPIYERVRQEFILQLSPETLNAVADYNKQNLAGLPGNDGTFLKPIENFYLDTYLAEFKPARVGNQLSFANLTETMVNGKSWASFLKKTNLSQRNYDIPFQLNLVNYRFLDSYKLKQGNNHLTINNGKVVEGNAIGSHQTFVVHGSLYDSETTSFIDYNERVIVNNFDDLAKFFRPQWGYTVVRLGNTKTILSDAAYANAGQKRMEIRA
jgi:hypothetical protein